jgi:hypothetical protein
MAAAKFARCTHGIGRILGRYAALKTAALRLNLTAVMPWVHTRISIAVRRVACGFVDGLRCQNPKDSRRDDAF